MKKQFLKVMLTMVVGLIISGAVSVMAQTTFTVDVGTGGDDLRGGNTAFMSLVLTSGAVMTEQVLSRGAGGRSDSTGNLLTFPGRISSSQIRSIRIRHDGNPRSGHPFDTYDNWNLRSLRVSLGSTTIYDSARDSRFRSGERRLETRFTGSLRFIDIPLRAGVGEADFIITGIIGSPHGLQVNIQNIGSGSGIVRGITCSTFGRTIFSGVDRSLASSASNSFFVRFVPSGTVTCSVQGVNSSGSAETVTANNISSRRF